MSRIQLLHTKETYKASDWLAIMISPFSCNHSCNVHCSRAHDGECMDDVHGVSSS